MSFGAGEKHSAGAELLDGLSHPATVYGSLASKVLPEPVPDSEMPVRANEASGFFAGRVKRAVETAVRGQCKRGCNSRVAV